MPTQLTPTSPHRAPQATPVKYDPEPQRDTVRGAIAFALVFGFLAVIAYVFYSTHGNYPQTLEVLDKVLPVLSGLLGSAVGFFFGSKSNPD